MTFFHNPLLLPLGKIERAWVERSSQNEASLHQTTLPLVEDAPEPFVHKLSGSQNVLIPFEQSPTRFGTYHC